MMRATGIRASRSDAGLKKAAPSTEAWVAAGGILAAIGATSCCILPLAMFSLGAGGIWIGKLTALAPYQPIIATIAVGLVSYGFWLVYRKPAPACADAATCTHPFTNRTVKTALWTATLLVLAALAFPYLVPSLLP